MWSAVDRASGSLPEIGVQRLSDGQGDEKAAWEQARESESDSARSVGKDGASGRAGLGGRNDWEGFEGERLGLIRQDWQIFAGISMLCLAGMFTFHYLRYGMLSFGQRELVLELLVFGAISGVTGFAFILRHGLLLPMNPVVSTLGITTLRLLTVLFVVGVASATKWNNSKSFAYVMLGCYFIFLLLESCLSVRWYSAWRRIVHDRRIPS